MTEILVLVFFIGIPVCQLLILSRVKKMQNLLELVLHKGEAPEEEELL